MWWLDSIWVCRGLVEPFDILPWIVDIWLTKLVSYTFWCWCFWIPKKFLNVLIVVICGTSLYMRLFYLEAFDCIAPISFQCVKDYCYACRQLCDSSNILFICIQTTDWLDIKRCIKIDMWPPFGHLSRIPAMQLTKQNTYILGKKLFWIHLKTAECIDSAPCLGAL